MDNLFAEKTSPRQTASRSSPKSKASVQRREMIPAKKSRRQAAQSKATPKKASDGGCVYYRFKRRVSGGGAVGWVGPRQFFLRDISRWTFLACLTHTWPGVNWRLAVRGPGAGGGSGS